MREINFEDFPAPGRLETPMKSADEPFRLSTSRSNPEGILEPCKASMLVAPLVVAQDAHDTTSCVRSPHVPSERRSSAPLATPCSRRAVLRGANLGEAEPLTKTNRRSNRNHDYRTIGKSRLPASSKGHWRTTGSG